MPPARSTTREVEAAAREALEPFDRGATGGSAEGPYQVQHDLQDMMQDLVGIVRREDEMARALDGIGKLKDRAAKVAVHGHREYNPGWHTAIDLKHLLTVCRGHHAARRLTARKAAAAISARIFRTKTRRRRSTIP